MCLFLKKLKVVFYALNKQTLTFWKLRENRSKLLKQPNYNNNLKEQLSRNLPRRNTLKLSILIKEHISSAEEICSFSPFFRFLQSLSLNQDLAKQDLQFLL
jgi:hypothetical protein